MCVFFGDAHSGSRFGEQDSCFSCWECPSWGDTGAQSPSAPFPNIPQVLEPVPAHLHCQAGVLEEPFEFSRDTGMLEEPFVFSRDTGIPEEEALLSSQNDLHHAGKGTDDKVVCCFSCLTDSSDSRGESCSPLLKGTPEEGNRRKSERERAVRTTEQSLGQARKHRLVWLGRGPTAQ